MFKLAITINKFLHDFLLFMITQCCIQIITIDDHCSVDIDCYEQQTILGYLDCMPNNCPGKLRLKSPFAIGKANDCKLYEYYKEAIAQLEDISNEIKM